MRKTTCSDSAHTTDTAPLAVETSPATSGWPNRLMTAFEVAEFVGCHEETVRRAYLRGLLAVQTTRTTGHRLCTNAHLCRMKTRFSLPRLMCVPTPLRVFALVALPHARPSARRRVRRCTVQELTE
jgi:hypothetical protein